MIHFDTNALIALPLWARESHTAIRQVIDGEPAAVCSVVWYEFLIGTIEDTEIDVANAFLAGSSASITTLPLWQPRCSMSPAVSAH